MKPVRLLYCDDHKSEREAFRRQVAEPLGDLLECEMVGSLEGVQARVTEREPYDILVSDLNFEAVGGGPTDGLRILRLCRESWPHVEVVMLTAFPDSLMPRQVLEASSYGITQETWLTKISDDPQKSWQRVSEVLRGLTRVIGERRLRYEAQQESLAGAVRLYANLRIAEIPPFDRFEESPEMVGRSPQLQAVWRQIRHVAATPATVLITGETGTGKELVSRAIHQLSGRGTLTALNCGEFHEALLASELFGHLRGAFTGADRDKPGLLASTGDGTLFLDEIAEMTLQNQAKFLRVLQEREYRPVGASQVCKTQVRVLAATNQNLAERVHTGHMRADFYDRLNIYRIDVPPLRERREDIPLLVVHYLGQLSGELGREVEAISEAALWKLVEQPWPENMRELINCLTRTVINLPQRKRRIDLEDLDFSSFESLPPVEAAGESPAGLWQQILRGDGPGQTLSELAKQHGKPTALEIVRLTMRHFQGLPPEADAQALFGMSYRNWQHWAHYNELTWEKVRRLS